ncbi:MAG: LacI family DNA-binding transcriptional regulator [Chloroflexi bacterium]|nr:LacI family DNA-binding transcriptional regulator [Chloroflexota bacterium]
MNDVAKAAGVSLKTVSRVINADPTVQREYVESVHAAVSILGFRRNEIARTLRSGQTSSTIGLVIEDLANPFYSAIASAVERVAAEHRTLLITASSEENPDREREVLQELLQRRVDGLLIVPAGVDHGFLRAEMARGVPVVFLDRPPTGLDADTVLLDNVGGARSGVEYMLARGHRRIGMLLDSLTIFTMRERLAGARAALMQCGVGFDDALLRDDVHDPGQASSAVAAMLDGHAPPTAFFCGNNRIAIGAALELARRDHPAALVAFDDFEASGLVHNLLTIIGYDNQELGRRAAEVLFRRVAGDRSSPERIMLSTDLRHVRVTS